jgi:hypothetical protein
LALTVIVAVPTDTPLTIPDDTVAIALLDDDHVNAAETVLPLASFAVGTSVTALPTERLATLVGVTDTAATREAVTVTPTDELTPFVVALMVADPGASAVTTPPLTLATEEFDDVQVKLVETS